MPFAILSDDLLDRLEAAGISRDARLLYVEGITWCARLLTDGYINARLSRVTDAAEPCDVARELVDAGFWSATAQGYLVTDYLMHNRPKSEVLRSQADARERKRRNRLHKSGDHSLCIMGRYCPDGAVTRDMSRDKPRDETPTYPLLSTPLRKEVEGEKGKGAADQSDALTRSGLTVAQEDRHSFADDGSGGCCHCLLPRANSRHREIS